MQKASIQYGGKNYLLYKIKARKINIKLSLENDDVIEVFTSGEGYKIIINGKEMSYKDYGQETLPGFTQIEK